MNGDLKQTFVLQCVQDYLRGVELEMVKAIIRRKAVDTGEGKSSVDGNARSNGAGATGELAFKEYLRFIDMGVGRGHPLGGLKATTVNLQSINKKGRVLVKDNTRRPKKIYAAIVYGRLNYLASKLMYGYTDAIIASLKQMNNAGNTNT